MEFFGFDTSLFFCMTNMNSNQVPSQEKPAPLWDRIRCRKLASFSSAQDLRCFEVEKEKEDNQSPRGVLEACLKDLDNEPRTSHTNTNTNSNSNSNSNSNPHSKWRGFLKLWKKDTMKRLPSFPPLSVPKMSRRISSSARESVDNSDIKSSWKNFTLSELKDATDNFSQENVIGKGGYAEVFKGCLPDGRLVAIKRLNKGNAEDQITGFLSEIGTIAHVNHPNTAKLVGFGVEGGSYLVLQLFPFGSLGSLLRGSKEKLTWPVRYKIMLGTAAGLRYLHENCQRRIIHRDIKADNILLTENFEPQICDFGLAKWLPNEWTHHNVPKSEGTFGYFAPEYFMHGIVDEKTDVFAYGVLLLELITGREALDQSQQSLVLWSKPLLDDNNVEELVDPSLNGNYNPKEMSRVISTASLCIEQSPVLRPRMSQVLNLLRGDNQSLKKEKRTLRRAFSEDFFDAEEYDPTDILRHKEVALGS